MLPRAKGVLLSTSVVKYVKGMVPKYDLPGAISFRKALHSAVVFNMWSRLWQVMILAFLQYTGGTTGVAKGAILTHRNMIANVLQAKGAYGPVLQEGREGHSTAALSRVCTDSELLAVCGDGWS